MTHTTHRELYVNQYVAFGLSGAPDRVLMSGGDVTVAWIDAASGVANAVDYYLESYSQVRLSFKILWCSTWHLAINCYKSV